MQSGGEASFTSLENYIDESTRLNEYFFGMELFDLEENKSVFDHKSDQFFTPASVNKWLTLYVADQYLSDSIAWMNIYEVDGKTIYQPMGDPTFMHPRFDTDERLLTYFSKQPTDTIFWSDSHFKDKRFGPGWAWDDYTYRYQPEKSVFPIQSNLFRVEGTDTSPSFMPSITYFDYSGNYPTRLWDENRFYLTEAESVRWIPFRTDTTLIKNFLVGQLKIYRPYKEDIDVEKLKKTIYSEPTDSAFKVLMKNSDNHIGEQLLLQVSQQLFNTMDSEKTIRYLQDDDPLLTASKFYWEDGSGLSRYNLSKPSSIVAVINAMVDKKGIDWLKEILPAGGQSGTISNSYQFDQVRVFAKTGTLRHNHNLAGIVQAKSGKWYSFSMMNNHLPGSSRIAKLEMENMMKLIVEFY